MKCFGLFYIMSIVCSYLCFSQTVESSSGIDKGILQIELESLYVKEKAGDETINSWSIPSTLLRYGINDKIEFQMGLPLINEKIYIQNELVSSQRIFDNAQMGFSINLWNENIFLPEAGFKYTTFLPLTNFELEGFGHSIMLNLSNTITNKLSFNYNIGYFFDSFSHLAFYIANITYEINSKIHCFSEIFGEFGNVQSIRNCMNLGIGACLTKSLNLDLSFANGLNHDMKYFGGTLSYFFTM